jgi:hypothetical protein
MRAPTLLAVLALALPALGAPQSSTGDAAKPEGTIKAKPPSEQARALSRALVPEPNWDRLLDRSADGLSEAVSRSLMAKGEKVPENLTSDIRKELGKDMKYAEAVDTQALALEKRFTGDEMKKATDFYRSPLGKKMLDRLPEAQSEVGDRLQERLATVVPGILERVAPSAVGGGGAGDEPDAGGTGDAGGTEEEEVAPQVPEAPEGSTEPEKKL